MKENANKLVKSANNHCFKFTVMDYKYIRVSYSKLDISKH